MENYATQFLYGLAFIVPALFANAVPVFIGGLGAIDRGKLFFDGKPILGKNKTIGGLLSATVAGGMAGIAIYYFFPDIMQVFPIWIGFIEGFAAMLGDATGSFIKRRINLKPGGPFPIMDQIGFVFFAFLLVYPFAPYPLIWAYMVVPATLVIHLLANTVAYLFGWKKVWW